MWKTNNLGTFSAEIFVLPTRVDGNYKGAGNKGTIELGDHGCIDQFVSNPTYIRRAILYFYVIFLRLCHIFPLPFSVHVNLSNATASILMWDVIAIDIRDMCHAKNIVRNPMFCTAFVTMRKYVSLFI